MKNWSKLYHHCTNCLTTNHPFRAKGLCVSCYHKVHLYGKIATCIECGELKKHWSNGKCKNCYQRIYIKAKRAISPEYRQKNRESSKKWEEKNKEKRKEYKRLLYLLQKGGATNETTANDSEIYQDLR